MRYFVLLRVPTVPSSLGTMVMDGRTGRRRDDYNWVPNELGTNEQDETSQEKTTEETLDEEESRTQGKQRTKVETSGRGVGTGSRSDRNKSVSHEGDNDPSTEESDVKVLTRVYHFWYSETRSISLRDLESKEETFYP